MPDETVTPVAAKSVTEPSHREKVVADPAKGWRNPSQWPAYLALGVAVIATALAALAYFHPANHRAAGPPQQSGDAKANVCAAYARARQGVVINTHLRSPDNSPASDLAVAANARLALVGGGAYLQQQLTANTAAPGDLTAPLYTLAGTMGKLGAGYMAGATAEALDPLRKDLDKQINDATKACS